MSNPVSTFAARRPLVSFFVLAYAGTWALLAPIVLGRPGLRLIELDVPFPVFAALFIASSFTGPTLAALIVTRAQGGESAMRMLLRRYRQWRVDGRWWLAALV